LSIRRKASSFEEYWLASKAWERRGLTTAVAQALVHNGFLSLDDLHGAHDLELATIPGIGRKSLAALRWATAIEFRDHLVATTEPNGPEIRH
jgi:Helix-hairpin-helix domain